MKNIRFDERFCAPLPEGEDNSGRLRRLQRQLRLAIDRELTERQAQMVELHYFQGMSCSQIARALEVQPSTVSRTLQRATARLRRVLRYSVESP